MWKIFLLMLSQCICFGHGFRQHWDLSAASGHRLRTIVTHPPLQRFVPNVRSATTSLPSIRSLSLDCSILPGYKLVGGGSGAQRLAFFIALTLLTLRNIFPSVISSLRSFAFSDGEEQIVDNTSSGIPFPVTELVLSAQKMMSSIISHTENLFIEVRSKLSVLYKDMQTRALSLVAPTDVVQLDDWKVCSLKSRELLSGGRYCRYRFELENGGARIPLYIGQEVS